MDEKIGVAGGFYVHTCDCGLWKRNGVRGRRGWLAYFHIVRTYSRSAVDSVAIACRWYLLVAIDSKAQHVHITMPITRRI